MNEERAKRGDQHALDAVGHEPVLGYCFPRWVIRLASLFLLLALCGDGYLAAVALTHGPVAGCGPESGCQRVLSSRWAYWLGLPVSLPALTVYLGLLAATVTVRRLQSPETQRTSLQVIFALSLLVLSAALWFFLLQKFILHAWCKFCLATHATAGLAAGLLLAALLSSRLRGRAASLIPLTRRTIGLGVCSALVGLTILVAGQVAFKKKMYGLTYFSRQPGASSGQLLLHEGRFRLDPNELPVLGSPTSTNLIVSVFDYTCTHCRALHPLLLAAEAHYQGRLGIIALPMPLDAACNPLIPHTAPPNRGACEYAKLGLAVWRAKREAYREFDDWLFASSGLPPLDQARSNAAALVGKDELDRELSSSWVTRQLQQDIALYQANGRLVGDARLPQLVIGGVITHGAIDNLKQLLALIEKYMQTSPSGSNLTHSSTP